MGIFSKVNSSLSPSKPSRNSPGDSSNTPGLVNPSSREEAMSGLVHLMPTVVE